MPGPLFFCLEPRNQLEINGESYQLDDDGNPKSLHRKLLEITFFLDTLR